MSFFYEAPLISFEEFQRLDRGNRLATVLDALDAEPLLHKLERQRRGRRDDYPIRVVWNSLIAGLVYHKLTITALIEELEINPGLRLLCGIRGVAGIPSPFAYSRFLAKLVNSAAELDVIFHRMVEKLRAILPDFGEQLAPGDADLPWKLTNALCRL